MGNPSSPATSIQSPPPPIIMTLPNTYPSALGSLFSLLMFKLTWFLPLSVNFCSDGSPKLDCALIWVSSFSLCCQIHLECHRFQEVFPSYPSAFTTHSAPSPLEPFPWPHNLTLTANVIPIVKLLTIATSQQLYEVGTIVTIVQVRKLRHGVKELAFSSYTAGKWQTRLGTQAV